VLSEVETRIRILKRIVSYSTGLAVMQLRSGRPKVNAWGESHL